MITHKPFRLLLGEKVGIGTSDPRRAQVAVVAKRAKETQQLNTANELVAAKLAELLGLPIPPFGVAYQDGTPYFYTADFNPKRLGREAFTPDGKLPKLADWTEITRERTPLCWGIILFDIWIVNPDRAPINIASPGELLAKWLAQSEYHDRYEARNKRRNMARMMLTVLGMSGSNSPTDPNRPS